MLRKGTGFDRKSLCPVRPTGFGECDMLWTLHAQRGQGKPRSGPNSPQGLDAETCATSNLPVLATQRGIQRTTTPKWSHGC